MPIESLNRGIQLALVTKCYECEAFGAARLAVGDDFDPFNRAVGGEEISNVFLGSGVGQVAHIDVHLYYFLVTPSQ